MDIFTLGAAILKGYTDRDKGNDNQDALIDTIVSEIAPWFAALFKNEGAEGIVGALNSLVLAVYSYSPDVGQFFIRLMVNTWSEKNQHHMPTWLATPLIASLKAYFGALEAATKDKDRPTVDDIKAAADNVAAEAKKTASELRIKFDAAKDVVKDMNIPNMPSLSGLPDLSNLFNNSPGGNMSNHTAPSRDKKTIWAQIMEGIRGGTSNLEALLTALKLAADEGEDYAQIAANGVYAAVVLGVVTVIALILGLLLLPAGPVPLALIIGAFSVVWLVGPLVGFTAWRTNYRDNRAREDATKRAENPDAAYNPNDKPGNGLVEGGALAGVTAFMGGGSTIVVAILCAFGAIFSFSWVYAFAGSVSIGLMFVTWVTADLGFDLGKSRVDKHGTPLLKGRITRTAAVVVIVWCAAMLLPMLNGLLNHTSYGLDIATFTLYLLLFAACINIRVNSDSGSAPVESLRELLIFHKNSDYKASRTLLFAALLVIAPSLLTINTILPPDEVAGNEEVSWWTPWKKESPPSYGKRIGVAVREALPPRCSEEVEDMLPRLETNTCKVVLQGGTNTEAIGRCREAVKCGALRSDGSTKTVAAQRVELPYPSFSWWWAGGLTALAIFLFFVVVGLKNPAPEKKKEEGGKKSAAH